MSLERIVTEMQAMTAMLKFEKYVKQAADAAGEEPEVFVEKKVKKKMLALTKKLPTDQVKSLKMYKEAVGPEMWEDIKNNPSLPDLVKGWAKAEAEKVMPQVVQILMSVLPEGHDMSEDDIKLVLDKMSDMAG